MIKNPHFAGGLCYGTDIEPDDGILGIHLVFGMGKLEVIKTMVKLYKHCFPRHGKTNTWITSELKVESKNPFTLEIDGDVVTTDHVKFDLLNKALRICQ